MLNENLKQILISILVGATVAFLTSLLEGALSFLRGMDPSFYGGAAATIFHMRKIV